MTSPLSHLLACDDVAPAVAGRDLHFVEVEILFTHLSLTMAPDAPPGETDDVIDELATTMPPSHPWTAAVEFARIEQAMRRGTADDVARAVATAVDLATPAQRVEIRWWARAAQAGLDIVRGDLVGATSSYVEAMDFGVGRGVQMAMSTALLSRFMVDWECGTFGQFHAFLPPVTEESSLATVAAHAHACIQAGDRPGALLAADVLAGADLIPHAVDDWPAVVSMTANVAWLLGHGALGHLVVDELAARDEAGLNLAGLCYLGSISLARGLALGATGRTDDALDLLHAAVERETWFGAPIWIARACRAAADLHDRRARPGDGRAAARLRRSAETAAARITLPATS